MQSMPTQTELDEALLTLRMGIFFFPNSLANGPAFDLAQ
jgi:hypothetical protein